MQATTTQSLPNNRVAAIALLTAAVFSVGAALGAIAGTNLAPKTAPAPVAAIQAFDRDPGLRLQRQGEITVATVVGATKALRWHRYGEINAAALPEVGTTPTGSRYEVVRGK